MSIGLDHWPIILHDIPIIINFNWLKYLPHATDCNCFPRVARSLQRVNGARNHEEAERRIPLVADVDIFLFGNNVAINIKS